jgi:hypothetical protein
MYIYINPEKDRQFPIRLEIYLIFLQSFRHLFPVCEVVPQAGIAKLVRTQRTGVYDRYVELLWFIELITGTTLQ